MRLAVIGAGTMGSMAARRLMATGMARPEQVRLSRVRRERRPAMETGLSGADLLEDNRAAVREAELVIIAVKPKHFAEVGRELRGHVPADALVISLMTAVDLAALAEGLGVPNVVRACTNIGIERGLATTYWMAAPSMTETSVELGRKVFEAWGEQIECSEESLLDIAMVGVGSGPALVIEFAQAMIRAMEERGMAHAIAEKGILSLLNGTAELVRGSTRSAKDFQHSVVTPGGITAAALQSMNEAGFSEIVVEAFQKALDRTAELKAPSTN